MHSKINFSKSKNIVINFKDFLISSWVTLTTFAGLGLLMPTFLLLASGGGDSVSSFNFQMLQVVTPTSPWIEYSIEDPALLRVLLSEKDFFSQRTTEVCEPKSLSTVQLTSLDKQEKIFKIEVTAEKSSIAVECAESIFLDIKTHQEILKNKYLEQIQISKNISQEYFEYLEKLHKLKSDELYEIYSVAKSVYGFNQAIRNVQDNHTQMLSSVKLNDSQRLKRWVVFPTVGMLCGFLLGLAVLLRDAH